MDFHPSNAESLAVVASGATVINQITPVFTSILDVRQYASYYLQVNGVGPSTPTGYNFMQVSFSWFSTLSGTTNIYSDFAEFFASQGGSFPTGGVGPFLAQDDMHGPFMRVQFSWSGPDTGNLSYTLMGSTRVLGQPYWRDAGAVSGITAAQSTISIPNNGTNTLTSFFSYGRHHLRIEVGTAGLGFNIVAGSFGNIYAQGLTANTNYDLELLFPKRSALITAFNGSGAAGNYKITVISQLDRV